MQLPDTLSSEDTTPSRLWSLLDPETRTLAARALYGHSFRESANVRREANLAIAAALRFREIAVKKLPVERRVDYLVRTVQPNDSLAHSLLMALHLVHRKELLAAFLDALAIPQQDGLIVEDYVLEPPARERLAVAAKTVSATFPEKDIALYFASLLAMDPETWGGLRGL